MFDYLESKIHDECGVFAVYSRDEDMDVVADTYYGLYALQHRGQESCGIAVNEDGVIRSHKDLGLVNEVFTPDGDPPAGQGPDGPWATARYAPLQGSHPVQQPAHAGAPRQGHHGSGLQRPAHQRGGAAGGAGAEGWHLPHHQRHRGHRLCHHPCPG